MTNRLGLSVSVASGEWIPLEMAIILPVMDAPLGQKKYPQCQRCDIADGVSYIYNNVEYYLTFIPRLYMMNP